MVDSNSPSGSPHWNSTTKTVISLTVMAIIAAMVIQFRSIIGPLILAFILTYLMRPLAERVTSATGLEWRSAVNLIYLILVVLLIVLITVTGLAVVQQMQSLIGVVNRFINDLPGLVTDLTSREYVFGPFRFDFAHLDLTGLTNQILSSVQPLLGRVGELLSSVATGAVGILGWAGFVLLISYFLMAEYRQVPGEFVGVNIPGYNADIHRLVNELRNIWDAYLRGQFAITILVFLIYSLILSVLGVRYAVGIAVFTALAKFIPYIGPFVSNTVTILVAFFQSSNYFSLEPWKFAILAVAIVVIVDQTFDSVVVPRFMGHTLGVHPAAVLVTAIVAANLLGIIGVILAAPVLATLALLGRYVLRKMFDLDPWPETERIVKPIELPWMKLYHWLRSRLQSWPKSS